MHVAVEAHHTPSGKLEAPGLGFGLGTTDHELPSHTITNATSSSSVWANSPTATHDDDDAHDTEFRRWSPLLKLGLGITDHELPSHTRASVRKIPPSPTKPPNAVHHDENTHDTAFSVLNESLGFGLGTIDHDVPSHTCESVADTEPSNVSPTATHDDVETHDTESN